MFEENIEIKENFFFCKICSNFSTTTKMRARSHVLSCGKIKKKGRPLKLSNCLQCDQKFYSRKELELHHRENHTSQSYTCSNCLKSFNRRSSYLRHLQSHKETPKLKCPLGTCEKAFRFKCDLARHMKTHNKPPPTSFDSKVKTDLAEYQVELEEGMIHGNFYGKYSVMELSHQDCQYQRNYTSFQSSIDGVKTMEDWDMFVNLSNSFRLPLVDDAAPGSVETCFFTNNLGEQEVKLAWNMFQNSDDIVSGIVFQNVDDAVDISIQNDPKVSDEEVMEIHENILRDIEGRQTQMHDPLTSMIMSRSDFIDVMDIGVSEDETAVHVNVLEVEAKLTEVVGEESHCEALADVAIGCDEALTESEKVIIVGKKKVHEKDSLAS